MTGTLSVQLPNSVEYKSLNDSVLRIVPAPSWGTGTLRKGLTDNGLDSTDGAVEDFAAWG